MLNMKIAYITFIYIYIILTVYIASRLTVDFQGNHTAAAVFSALWFHVWLQMLPVVPTVKASALSQNTMNFMQVSCNTLIKTTTKTCN